MMAKDGRKHALKRFLKEEVNVDVNAVEQVSIIIIIMCVCVFVTLKSPQSTVFAAVACSIIKNCLSQYV